MYIKNNWLFMVYKLLIAVFAAYGLQFHMRTGSWSDFNYYTVLSNAACFLYFLCSFTVNVRRLLHDRHVVTWKPRLEGAVVFCITVTFLIYHFILRPEAFRMGNGGSFYSVLNMVQHYIVPVGVIFDWLLFCPKGRWHRYDPAAWLLAPLFYFVYILIRAPFAGNIGGTSSPYPYGFIDVQALGVGIVARNALLVTVAMLLLAYVVYFVDYGLGVLQRRRVRRLNIRKMQRAA